MSKSIAIVRRAGLLTLPLIALAPAGQAQAGGFGIREQSSYYQGSSFAGNAAGGEGLASMYWNPAAISFTPGFSMESNATYIMPHASVDVTRATDALGANLGTTGIGDIVDDKLLPTTYFSYAWDRIAIGVGVTVPFGLVTDASCNWSGRYYGCHSSIFDLNVQGSLAYKVTDWLTLGGGLNVNYLHAKLSNAQFVAPLPVFNNLYAEVTGDDIAMGFNLGALFTLMPGTTVGIGYKSALDQRLDGNLDLYALQNLLTTSPAQAKIKLPDQATLSLRSKLDEKWTVLGTVEWTNWSTLDELVVTAANGATSTLDLQWKDGWFFSGGVEYQWDPKLALRGGLAYELTPVPDETRSPRLPDTNRFWISGGFTYAVTEQLSMDFAYSHLFANTGPITQLQFMPGNLARGNLIGEVNDGYVDLVSVGLRYKFGQLTPGPVTMD